MLMGHAELAQLDIILILTVNVVLLIHYAKNIIKATEHVPHASLDMDLQVPDSVKLVFHKILIVKVCWAQSAKIVYLVSI